MMIKTFAYWKTLKKRLIDYVQMACRCNLSAELIDQKLKPALVTATESAGSLCTLMAPDDALARSAMTSPRASTPSTRRTGSLRRRRRSASLWGSLHAGRRPAARRSVASSV